jgi:hypothetical protein
MALRDVRRDPSQRDRDRSSSSSRSARLRHLHRGHPRILGFAADPTIPDWGQDISTHYQSINAGYWWPVLFPSLAIATLIVGINLIADAIAQLFER